MDRDNLFLSCADLTIVGYDVWFLDCTCSNHMAHERSYSKAWKCRTDVNFQGVMERRLKWKASSAMQNLVTRCLFCSNYTHNFFELGKTYRMGAVTSILTMIDKSLETRKQICLQLKSQRLEEEGSV